MSRITFGTPVWDAHRSIYMISVNTTLTVLSEAQYIDLSGNSRTVETPDTDSDLFKAFIKEFTTALIETDAQNKWFASRLKEASIMKRLSYGWISPNTVVSTFDWAEAEWTPSMLEISTSGFILSWSLIGFNKTSPKISLRFLPPMSRPESPTQDDKEVAEVRQITLQPSLENELQQVHDIPFTNENTAVNFEQQVRDRGALQEARLRLALAKLKESRLSNTYYQKYGEVLTDEDSDGTSEMSD